MNLLQRVRKLAISHNRNIICHRPIINIGHITLRLSEKARVEIGSFFSCRDEVVINVSNEGQLHFGDNVFLNDGVKINCRKKIDIGDRVIIGQNVLMYDHDHDFHAGIIEKRDRFIEDEIVIGNDVWIGSNVTILRGCKIGDGSIIGAGTICKGVIPPKKIVYSKQELVTKEIGVN